MKISDRIRASVPARGAAPVRAVSTAAAAVPIVDVREPESVLGIPNAELTPRVREALVTLMHEVENLRKELERTQERLAEMERLAETDSLSPVANRRGFVRELSRVMSYAERHQVETAILFFDVDGLKTVNDTHGHAAGDAVLQHVADVLRAQIRQADIVGRLGGDEFAVILTHANETQANLKADQLQSMIAATPVDFDGIKIATAASVGVYIFGPGETPTNVLSQADKKMYDQKRARRANRA
jgi:diguanylate cyclase (GGDEF)-like protein